MIMKNHKLVLVLHDYCQDSLKTGRNFSISKLRTALPSFFIKHTLIRFGKDFPKFTKLYGFDHWPTFENI